MTAWARRSRFREFVDTAAWPIPMAYLIAAGVFGIAVPAIDKAIGEAVPAEFGVGAAQALLTAFATGLITVTGFIITVVIAGATFSGTAVTPRIVREFRRNTTIKHVFGLLLFSVVYAFLVLNRVAPPDAPNYVPDLAVWLVTPLLVLDVLGLMVLIREMGRSLRLVEIIDRVYDRAEQVIGRMYGEVLREDADDTATAGPLKTHARTICNTDRSGIVASLDLPRLVHEARRSDTVLELACPIGSYLPFGAALFHVADPTPELDEHRLQRSVTLTDERTIDQDPLYALRLIVDIATRALSAAVNDPTTAVQALDRIEAILLLIATHRLDVGAIPDEEGEVRLIVPLPRWDDYVTVAITEIREYGARSTQVARRLRAVLSDLLQEVPAGRRPALEHQLVLLDAAITRAFPDPDERAFALVADRHGLGEPATSRQRSPAGMEATCG
jgi:uncharacterized membrane protein